MLKILRTRRLFLSKQFQLTKPTHLYSRSMGMLLTLYHPVEHYLAPPGPDVPLSPPSATRSQHSMPSFRVSIFRHRFKFFRVFFSLFFFLFTCIISLLSFGGFLFFLALSPANSEQWISKDIPVNTSRTDKNSLGAVEWIYSRSRV